MATKEKDESRHVTRKAITEALVDLFQKNPDKVFNRKKVFQLLELSSYPVRSQCAALLSEMVEEKFLTEPSPGLYKLMQCSQWVEGVFQRHANGKNELQPDDGGESVFVAERNSAHAMDGDRVRVALFARKKKQSIEGEVIAILKRAKDTFVGTLQVEKHYAFLLTESRVLANDIFIPYTNLKGGKNGEKAVVKIVEWPTESKNPIGEVVDILGRTGENNAEMNAILVEFGLPYTYPKNVENAADRIDRNISAEDLKGREDFRNTLTFTVDPKDAKDFDDALSYKKLGENLWEIGVHIADVTHFVKEGGAIDKEAFKRATSIYLVDRTIPMLPESLCNDLCSLRPGEDRLTYSVVFKINEKAQVSDSRIVHSVIHSDRRFAYEEVQAIIESGEGEYSEEILRINDLAKKLREKRFANGAINFERTEVRFEIDENGKPLNVIFKESKEANKLIEEFMLLANRTVAERIGDVPKRGQKVFVYRIHDKPDPEKFEALSEFAARFGHKMRKGSKGDISAAINHLLDEVKGTKEENVIEMISIRAMQKAVYSTCNIGHYGLAFKYYTHFTSPIRRYPDMMVHRLLDRYLSGGRSVQESKYEDFCDHCSSQEQLAANAERASIKYKQVEFMNDRVGEIFDAVISGVTEWGFYAEINENKCEGLVPVRSLEDDFYEFDERNYCLMGRRTHRCYSLGDPVKIRIVSANLEKKQLDYELAEKNDEKGRKSDRTQEPAREERTMKKYRRDKGKRERKRK